MAVDNFLHLYKEVYYNLPQPIKSLLGSVYGNIPLKYRFGKPYATNARLVQWFENASDQEQQDFLYSKTYETLNFAQKHIPFYTNSFNECGVSIEDFKYLEDIKKFPTLTKDDIKANLNNLYTSKFQKPAAYFTGGSTSTPTQYYLPLLSSRGKEKAYNDYIFSKLGKGHREKTLLLKGRDVSDIKNNVFWAYEPVDNYLEIASSYINSENFDAIFDKAVNFSPKYIFGYPSAVIDFIRSAQKRNVCIKGVKGVILASEMVFDDEVSLIEKFFGAQVLSHYGHTERSSIAFRLGRGPYKFLNSYGLSRCVNNELVSTSFDNFVMPFVNYATNDFISGDVLFYGDTDVVITVDDIQGRMQEHLVTNDGRLISICVIGAGHFSSLSNIDAIQYIQDVPGKVKLLVQGPRSMNKTLIKQELEGFVGEGLFFEVLPVNYIEKTSRGKRVLCKQSLDIQAYRL